MRAAERPQSVGGHCIEISSMCVCYATITSYPGHDDNDNKRFKGVDCASSSTPSSSSRLRFRDFFSYITHQSLSGLKDTHSSHP